MTKNELVKEISKKTNITQKDVNLVLASLVNTIYSSIESGDTVDITGLIKFSRSKLNGRKGKIPGTDIEYETKDKFIPKARISSKFKGYISHIEFID